jgi:hypothetical protein
MTPCTGGSLGSIVPSSVAPVQRAFRIQKRFVYPTGLEPVTSSSAREVLSGVQTNAASRCGGAHDPSCRSTPRCTSGILAGLRPGPTRRTLRDTPSTDCAQHPRAQLASALRNHLPARRRHNQVRLRFESRRLHLSSRTSRSSMSLGRRDIISSFPIREPTFVAATAANEVSESGRAIAALSNVWLTMLTIASHADLRAGRWCMEM